MEHIAIMDEITINKILTGQKIIESRFSKNKIAPFNNIKKGEIVFLKKSGGDVLAYFEVDNVVFFEDLDKEKVKNIKEKYSECINAPLDFWISKMDSKYATLIFIKNPQKIEQFVLLKKIVKHLLHAVI
jgi:ASC-1-like (ASCH) protein